MAGQGNPMRGMVEAMEQLESAVRSENPTVDLQLLVRICRLGAQFVTSFEGAFKFAAVEVENKANDLEEAWQKYNTVEVMLDYEITNGLARENSSHTRFNMRIKRAADLLRVFFQEILAREGDSLVPPLRKAYDEVFGAYHGASVKDAVYFAMEWIMDKAEFFNLIDDDDDAARELMKRYISASACVCQHIEQLYRSTKVGAELLRMI
ncbi:hypothetical protein RND71_016346 [Anisodus tanguticus]|uniref:Glycolipid transfer protein domain-containing protein n=1 Tax=Anisodus tanguticus TaxID=243964 RepID=A0AAE1VCL1_9SOLA|nr:hypothetical protein RND71_016346 [Anisodus tanguticus]